MQRGIEHRERRIGRQRRRGEPRRVAAVEDLSVAGTHPARLESDEAVRRHREFAGLPVAVLEHPRGVDVAFVFLDREVGVHQRTRRRHDHLAADTLDRHRQSPTIPWSASRWW